MNSLNLIPPLSTFQYNGIPAGLIIVSLDEHMTILEANKGYYDILGYTREEVRDLFQNSGLNTIHKDDVASTFATIKSHLIGESNEYSIRLRLVNKQDNYRIIHMTANTEYRDGLIYLHLLLLDLSKHYELFQQIKDEHDFNTILSSLTDDSYFDYNCIDKTIRFSPAFVEKFSLPVVVKNYPHSLIEQGIITEDFIMLDSKHIQIDEDNNNSNQQKQQDPLYTNNVSFIFNDEAYHYDISYKAEKDEKGKIVRIIGKMNDVTKQFEQIENLTFISQMDQLTGLYNKVTTERLITNTLKNRRLSDNIYALFIIDADNFKAVNDTFGHLYGDIVLTQLADCLKGLFRSNDIIGRIGGDEFIVLLRDYSTIKLISKKAQEICNAFKRVYTENSLSVEISASVGVSIFPEHGKTFTELYENADIALYNVKASGKANFQIYDGNKKGVYVSNRTKVDENIIKKDFKENQIEYIYKLLSSFEDSVSAVQAVLPLLMNQYKFTRAFFYDSYTSNKVINSYATSVANNHHELLTHAYNRADFINEVEYIKQQGFYYRNELEYNPNIKKHSLFAHSTTLFLYPIISENSVIGMIGFDSDIKGHSLSEESLENLKTISSIITTFIAKDLAVKRARSNEEMVMSVLDELDIIPLAKIKERIKEFLKTKDSRLK